MPLKHRLIFIRHGETDWNVVGRLQGQQDIPLNPRGRDQAASAGRTLRHWLDKRGDKPYPRFVASPLGRARHTMEIARTAMKLDPTAYDLDPGLMELSFGIWEGFTWPEVKQRDPIGAAAREADKWGFAPPSGESYAMLADRMRPWIERMEGETVAVSHGGVARVLMNMIGGLEGQKASLLNITQGRVIIFEPGRFYWL